MKSYISNLLVDGENVDNTLLPLSAIKTITTVLTILNKWCHQSV